MATVFYITAKKRGERYATEMIRYLLGWATVATVGQDEALAALVYGISDEDALQCAYARASGAAWFITRDEGGFKKSPVPSLSPDEFLRQFSGSQ